MEKMDVLAKEAKEAKDGKRGDKGGKGRLRLVAITASFGI